MYEHFPAFLVEVEFYSHKKSFPVAGYRPHILLDEDSEKEYLGITFTEFSHVEFDVPILATIQCMYDGVGYEKINPNMTFKIVEGANCVGHGKIIEILKE